MLIFGFIKTNAQPDIQFHINAQFLQGKNVLKVYKDFYDPYVWVLAQNNQVYRINSVTQAIDDYTAKFSAYNNLSFIDIAGRSQDTVFIAAHSPDLIQYTSGRLKHLGTAEGIPDTINSIGMESNGYDANPVKAGALLMIATNTGFRRYDPVKGQIQASTDKGKSRVFVATYRETLYTDSSASDPFANWPPIQFLPVINTSPFTTWIGAVDEGTGYGYNVQTDDLITDAIVGNTVFASQAWGNNTGLFGGGWNYSTRPDIVHPMHYMDGIKINKLTDIYGLVAFGGAYEFQYPGLIQQNLLIGTNQGLYYTNTIYQSYNQLLPLSIFHDDELGNVMVNDIAVNVAKTTLPICEDGVWVATSTGLYYLKPDYPVAAGTKNLKAIYFSGKDPAVNEADLCPGQSITAQIDPSVYLGETIQWYKDGQELPGESKPTTRINNAGEYYAVVYDPCSNFHVESNHLTVVSALAPVIYRDLNPLIQYCDSSVVHLSIDVNPPGVVYDAPVSYRWYFNGTLNGSSTPNYVATQSGKYRVEVSTCSGNWVSSKEAEVDLVNLPVPSISADKPVYCTGDVASLTVNTPVDASYNINWLRDGQPLTQFNNQANINVSSPGNYSATLNSTVADCSKSSAVFSLSFAPPPSVSIEKIVKTTLCDGQTVELKADYTGGTVLWSTGESSDNINVSSSGTYQATVTSAAGCQNSASADVQFLPNPVIAIPDTSLCQFTRQTLTLTAPAGFVSYSWNNGASTGASFQVNFPQTVTLTVTDANGCQATQQIIIGDVCADIHIPNTFTPNGDGVNDKWVISGLSGDPSVAVRVYTRYGTLIYDSMGYAIPWDGTYNGKALPAGVYYYIITAKNNQQKLSGSVTIIH